MADQTKEDKALAPDFIHFQYRGDKDDDVESMPLSEQAGCLQKYIKCCGCVTAILSILAVVTLVLMFTVFNLKDPSINISNIELANGTLHANTNTTNTNMTLVADVSIKNPNAGPFEFDEGWLTIYCGDTMVGEARTPPGKAKAEATIHMNVTVVGINPSLRSEKRSGALSMSARTMVGGDVRVINIISKDFMVERNCSMTYNISSGTFQVEN